MRLVRQDKEGREVSKELKGIEENKGQKATGGIEDSLEKGDCKDLKVRIFTITDDSEY